MAVRNQSFQSYDFKSVGEDLTEYKNNRREDIENKLPIGIATPMRFSHTGGLFKMHFDLKDQINDNFKNLLMTNHGERLGASDYGANLQELVFELGSEKIDKEAIRRIKSATKKYMPYLNLETFEAFREESTYLALANIGIKITYTVPLANSDAQLLKVVLQVGG